MCPIAWIGLDMNGQNGVLRHVSFANISQNQPELGRGCNFQKALLLDFTSETSCFVWCTMYSSDVFEMTVHVMEMYVSFLTILFYFHEHYNLYIFSLFYDILG